MSPVEVAWRSREQVLRLAWRRRQVAPGRTDRQSVEPRPAPGSWAYLPADAAAGVPQSARTALLRAADDLLAGRWEFFGVARPDILEPDWFLDPATGRRAPQHRYAFDVDHRSEAETGNVKQVWELSRHHHLTLLSAAWFLTGDDRYAEVVARQLQSWWEENPFLSGVHWTSGIELGVRLISWAWIRRLLQGWPGVDVLFEENELAVRQVRWHQEYLAAFRSFGSSGNNHVIAEAAGQLVASCAFPWYRDTPRWRQQAAELLERELDRNTFPSGVNRELATDYHRFVTELGLVAAIEAGRAGHPLADATWARLCRMMDVAAALCDTSLQPPRQGDGDDGRALVLDTFHASPWFSLLALGAGVFGAGPWWPGEPAADVRSTLVLALAGGRRDVGHRSERRPSHFPDAGITILRTQESDHQLWCRCDGGPHGYLSIAAHAHADALSIEVRESGVEILSDPGTYCYHGEPRWRAYFRSTLAHNTLELGGLDQSEMAGPFLWASQGRTTLLQASVHEDDGTQEWSAEHDGYTRLDPPAVHRRTVRLDRSCRRLSIVDHVETVGRHRCRLAFHLGPSVNVMLEGAVAFLQWPAVEGSGTATLRLADTLEWTAHRGETDPIMGWYSSTFGSKQPAFTLLGTGWCGAGSPDLTSVLEFEGA
ncbi:MAG: heparinase II/III family protein [Actinobacteria bacterium]|nr:heparinase II/III family protein [Actinomycetota bacterium]